MVASSIRYKVAIPKTTKSMYCPACFLIRVPSVTTRFRMKTRVRGKGKAPQSAMSFTCLACGKEDRTKAQEIRKPVQTLVESRSAPGGVGQQPSGASARADPFGLALDSPYGFLSR